MLKPDISVVIVNWKVRKLLEQCLKSIKKASSDINVEVIVVDNDSRDGTAEMMMVEYPNIKTISLQRNYGFAAGNNLGIKMANADYVMLLNPDTEVPEGFFKNVVEHMNANEDIAILGPKLVNPDGSLQHSVRRFPDLVSQILILLKLRNILVDNKRLAHYLAHDFDYSKEQTAEQVMGAAMVIRRSAMNKLGLLDEGFFIWFEEIDYCFRAHKEGLKVVYTPLFQIVHHGGVSFENQSTVRKQMMFNKSLLYYFRKHGKFVEWFVLLLLMPLSIILTLSYVIFIKERKF